MNIEQTVKSITNACNKLKETYGTLAKGADQSLQRIKSDIGQMKQWKYTCSDPGGGPHGGGPPTTQYSDYQYNWFEKLVHGVMQEEHVDHPRRAEAQKKAEDLFGKADRYEEKFGPRVESIADTPVKIGQLLTAWLQIQNTLAKLQAELNANPNLLIKNPAYEAGWESPIAQDAYGAVVGGQDGAADTTADVISGLLNNSANFLADLGDTLAQYAEQTRTLNKYYTDVITGTIGSVSPPTFDSIIAIIQTGSDAVDGHAQMEDKKAKDLSDMLNKSIAASLAVAELNNKITRLGKNGSVYGWPGPVAVGSTSEHGHSKRADLVMDARYFTEHAKYWDSISAQLEKLGGKADGVADIPKMFVNVPEFSADQSEALNGLSGRITNNLLKQGAAATSDLASKLKEARHAYLLTETNNEALVKAIEKQLADG